MTNQSFELVASSSYPGILLDVHDGRLITVQGHVYEVDQLQRVVELVKSFNWDRVDCIKNPETVDYLFQLVKMRNDIYSERDRKLEKQMLKLYLQMSGLPVTNEEVELLHDRDQCNFSKLKQNVILFRKAHLPITASVAKALQVLEVGGIDSLLVFAAPWIENSQNESEILMLLGVIHNFLKDNQETLLRYLETRIGGLTPFQKVSLLGSMSCISNEECFNVFGRLSPVYLQQSYAQRVLEINSAILLERQEINQLIQKWNLSPELVSLARALPYYTRGATFELAHRLFSNNSVEDQRSLLYLLHTIPTPKHELFLRFVSPLIATITGSLRLQTLSLFTPLFIEMLSQLTEDKLDLFIQKPISQQITLEEKVQLIKGYIYDVPSESWTFDLGDMNEVSLMCTESLGSL